MKPLIIAAGVLLLSAATYAQNPEKALIRVRYTFSHIQDTTRKDRIYTENMLLVAGRNAAVYTSYDKIIQSINLNKQIQEQIKNNAGGPQNIKIEKKQTKPISQEDYYFFAHEQKLFIKEQIFNNYLIEEPISKINWKILKDTASFSGVNCQKAVTTFKGRNWTVWFATELPFQWGPWKLQGLPGLIIEAYDDKKEVQFRFAGMETVTPENTVADKPRDLSGVNVKVTGLDLETNLGSEIKLPADVIKTTKKELDKLKEARDKDPQGFMNAQMAANGMKGSLKVNPRRASAGLGSPGKIVVNNPIELSEK